MRTVVLVAALSAALSSIARAQEGNPPTAPPTPAPAPVPAPVPEVVPAPQPVPMPDTGPDPAPEPEPEPDRLAPPVEPPEEAKSDKRGDGKGQPDVLRFGGRVFVRDTVLGREVAGETSWREIRDLDSGRAFIDFRPNKRLKMVLEVEFSGSPDVRDAYLRYRPLPFLGIRAGNFKKPVSFISLESSWSLPRVARGLLQELPAGELPWIGGRSYGVALEIEPETALEPSFTVTVQQNELATDAAVTLGDNLNQDLYARFEIAPLPILRLAVAGGLVDVAANQTSLELEHRRFGSLEARLETAALRVWLEGFLGQNMNATRTRPTDSNTVLRKGAFLAARGMLAPRWEDLARLHRLEPYAAVSWLDLVSTAEDDQLLEITVGTAINLSRHLRLQVEGARQILDDDAGFGDATLVRVQLGAAFESKTELD